MNKLALLALLPIAALAGDPPDGWRDLKFGMTEKQVEAQILKYRNRPDREWESTGLTAMPLPDLSAKTIAQTDLDAGRFRQWMIGHLDDGAATVRAFFVDGRLFAVQVMGVVDFGKYVEKAEAAYGARAERATFRWSDATSTGKPKDARELKVAFWRGGKTTALIYQPSGWGPELFIASNDGLKKARQSLARPATPAEDATRF